MTDLSVEPVVADPATAAPEQSPAPEAAPQKQVVEHTPGGWPVVPLALTGANTTATLLAGAALAGGPVAAIVATTGAVVLGAAAHRTKNKPHRAAKAADKPGKPGSGARRMLGMTGGGRTPGGRVPSQPKRSSVGGRLGGSGSLGAASSKRSPGSAGASAAGRRGTTGARKSRATTSAHPSPAHGTSNARVVKGRLGQVRAVRQEARAVSPSRAERRAGTTSARRQVADARRAAKQQAHTASAASKGAVGRAVARGTGAAGKARTAAAGRLRTARDAKAASTVAERRAQVRKAAVRKKARVALWRSAARFQGRRLLAALLGGALGIVGLVSTPLGRKLGWQWLQHPGRRLYARLVKQARADREARDAAIRAQLGAELEAASTEAEEQIGDRAERPAGHVPTTPMEGDGMSGFNFEEQAAEMESAAQNYEPESAMEILAMVESLPAALTSVANTMRILAERSDSEFPLDKSVADGFNDIFGALMSAVAVAEDMGPSFRQAHEYDIARHEAPRNGYEAEKGWNV